MVGYIAILPLISLIYWSFTNKKEVNLKWVKIYNKILVILFSFIAIVNFNVYREWGTKINDKIINFVIETPNEALASSASSPFFLAFCLFVILVGTGLYLQFLLLRERINFTTTPIWLRCFVTVILLFLNFWCIRGGFGVAPNSQSMAYFSKHQVLNQASLNTEWNLMSTILASKKTHKNPYLYFDEKEASSTTRQLFSADSVNNSTILNTTKPNIVLIILESFTADLTKTLGNEVGITPTFDQLISDGLLFSQIYAAGNRTDKGIIGTLTGYPTLATGSIVKWPEKMQKLPAISSELANNGYQTSFYYGGESEFDNYKAFILSHNYQRLVDRNSFDKKDMNSKWGAYDALVFNKQLQELNVARQPFFSTLLTLTNHEPFEVPGSYKFGNSDIIQKFKSTAYYTDSCINAYLTEAKKQSWYKNTLFIFIADHGHLYPKNNREIFEPQRYHIPLLFYGDVIKKEFRGTQIAKVGSQQDLAATLLAQLNLPTKSFNWSKNLFDPKTNDFAFFSWDDGFGFIDGKHCVTFDNIGKNVLYNSAPKDTAQTNVILRKGKSYLQTAYQQFIKL